MNERERWIVYPLLFLALGAALRDKLVDYTTRRIICQELIVVDEASIGGQPLVLARMGRIERRTAAAPPAGYLAVNGQVSVAGAIDAQNYAMRGIPLVPAVQAMVSPGDIWRAFKRSAEALQQGGADAGAQPPAGAADQAAPPVETPSSDVPTAESSD